MVEKFDDHIFLYSITRFLHTKNLLIIKLLRLNKGGYMYLNTFLITFGLNPDNFKNKLVEPIITEDKTFLYNLEQRTDIRICPECGCIEANINDYYYTETRSTSNEGLPTIIRIKKARFKCKACGKTFVMNIDGIDRYSKISNQTKQLIKNEFKKQN